MAATLTDSGELTFFSFGIEKVESTPDGDLMVYGRATDGSVDHDEQIVDPAFSSKAISDWYNTGGNIRVQHNAQRDPAGVGIEVNTDADGATWVKSLIVEPIAKKLISKGALRAYSVGISNPTIERDITGKARGGIIKSGKIVEISLVDRPANARCGVQLVKSVDGVPEYTGQLFGEADEVQKALTTEIPKAEAEITLDYIKANITSIDDVRKGLSYINETYGSVAQENTDDISSFDPASISFTPNDLWEITQKKMAQNVAIKAIIEEEEEILGKDHREFSQDTRRNLASRGHALPDGSYPIPDRDALRRAAILARSGHGNAAGAKRLIARRARELGVPNPLDSDDTEKVLTEEVTPKEDTPDIIKDSCPMCHGSGKVDGKPCPKCSASKAASPPDNGKPFSQSTDADGDNDGDGDAQDGVPDQGSSKAAKPPMKPKKGKGGKKLPPWLNKPSGGSQGDDDSCKVDHVHTEKCHTDPKTASGAEEAADMDPAPLGELVESPAKPHMKSYSEAAAMRFKTLGIDTDMGQLHDLSCAAYHPEEVAKYYPYADFRTLINEEVWQRKALSAATGKSITEAMEAQQVWQAATILKSADPGLLNDYRLEAHKAFRDANPGPTSYPSPGSISPQRFNRPRITDGHSQDSSGYGSPNSSATVASSSPNAHHFDRPPLGSGHQSPSPAHMKGGFEYPTEQGVPTRLTYAEIEKEKARRALSMMHDHIIHMFPSVCPMLDQDAYRVEQPVTSLNPIVGVSKTEQTVQTTGEVLGDVYDYIQKLEKKVRAGFLTEEEARNKLAKKTAQRYAKALQRQVQQGITSIDEVRKALGLPEWNETLKPVPVPPTEPQITINGAPVTKAVTADNNSLTPDIMKTMMSEILEPLQKKIEAQEAELTELRAGKESQQAALDEQNERWKALANQPDPSTAAFTGLAVNPARQRPGGVVKSAEVSNQVQGMVMRQLERTWRTSDNPAEREAAYSALQRYKGNTE